MSVIDKAQAALDGVEVVFRNVPPESPPPVYDESGYPSGGRPRWLRAALFVALAGLLVWGAFAWFDAHAVRGMRP